MTLTAHRPARSVASLVADDPAELAADLPRLPRGVVLDLEVLRDAACGPDDLEHHNSSARLDGVGGGIATV